VILLLPLYSAVLPFLLWPLEYFLPYPHLVEEVAKGVLLWFLVGSELTNKQKMMMAVVVGFVFGFSESNFYIINALMGDGIRTYFLRLVVVTPMHILTSVAIVLPALKSKKRIWIGIVGAILIHSGYNLYVSGIRS